MLYTEIQPQIFLSNGGEAFYHNYMGMAAILFNGTEPFDQIVNILRQKATCEILWKLFMRFRRRICLKISQFYACI